MLTPEAQVPPRIQHFCNEYNFDEYNFVFVGGGSRPGHSSSHPRVHLRDGPRLYFQIKYARDYCYYYCHLSMTMLLLASI